jgi:paraquat-inducible protein A
MTAAILFVLANSFPFITLTIEGREQQAELASSVLALWRDDMWLLSAVVCACAILLPAIKITTAMWVLLPMRLGRRPWGAATGIRLVERLHPWAMTEVYMIGVLVAYVKLVDLARIELGTSLWAFAALIVVLTSADASLDTAQMWHRLKPQATASLLPLRAGGRLTSCHACDQLLALPYGAGRARCGRCGSTLHQRKPDSLGRTWALLIAAAMLYIPANLLPVMTVTYLGAGEPSTIISGVLELATAGMWPLAAVVFFASILVPVLKLVGLTYLLLSVQFRSTRGLRDKTRLYRIIEQIGRWSMIDVFMIGILTALVNLGSIATITPGPGAVCFAAVVIFTMFASLSFDPRLMWDSRDAKFGRHALRA